MASFELASPTTLEEAIGLLDDTDPSVRPMGGGTALMLMMKSQIFEPVRLVSLRKIAMPLRGSAVDADSGHFRLGAMTTFSELEHSESIKHHFPAVVEAMRDLANVRVRNVATIGGNLAHGDPHLDLPPIWTALDAEIVVVSRAGTRRMPVEDIFVGYYETSIADGEIITELHVPIKPTWRTTYAKVTTRALHDWPALGIAVSLEMKDARVADVRIVLSAAIDKPTRLRGAEEVLRGEKISQAVLDRAGDVAVSEADIHGDSRGSTAYKNHLLRLHLARAIQKVAGV